MTFEGMILYVREGVTTQDNLLEFGWCAALRADAVDTTNFPHIKSQSQDLSYQECSVDTRQSKKLKSRLFLTNF